MPKIYMDKDYTYVRCPCCQAELQFITGSEPAITHLIRCAQEKVGKEHPEVSDDQLDLKIEAVDAGEGPESEDEMYPPNR